MEQAFCPGSSFIRTPTLTIKICPVCGGEVEVFSSDATVNCERCGFKVYNDQQSCIDWCKYARECFGDEVYEELRGKGTKGDGGDGATEGDAAPAEGN